MAMKLWGYEKKSSTLTRYLKQGDIFCFVYNKQECFFGRILAVDPKKYCIVEVFDHTSDKPEIDEKTILEAERLLPPFNVDSKYVFQDKLMSWDWRIIGHQDGFVAPDQDNLFMLENDDEQGLMRVDLQGNAEIIPEEDRSKYISVNFHDPRKKMLEDVIIQKRLKERPKPDSASASEEEVYQYANPLFDARKYAEVVDVILSFPKEKMTQRMAGLLIAALNNTDREDEAIQYLDQYKALFSEDMYFWYYLYGYAILKKKEYDELLKIIEIGLDECEKAYAAGKVDFTEYARQKGRFNYFASLRKEALEEQKKNYKIINGFVIDGDELIRYEGDPNISEVVIPDGVRAASLSFLSKNINIKSLVFPEGLETIGQFSGCINLEKIVFPSTLHGVPYGSLEDTKWYKAQPKGQIRCGRSLYKYTGEEEEVIIEDGVESIENKAFMDNKKIRKVTIPESVKVISPDTFKNCTNLSEVILPKNLDFISSYAFQNCVSLEKIALPDGMTKIANDVFSGCVNLRELIFPDTIEKIYGGGIFDGCKNLEKVHLPAKAEGHTYIEGWEPRVEGYLFRGCEKLKEVTIPKGITKIMQETFNGCTSIEKIVVENPDLMFGKDTFGKKAKYPEMLYKTSPELPLHLTDGDIKQYIDLDRLPVYGK